MYNNVEDYKLISGIADSEELYKDIVSRLGYGKCVEILRGYIEDTFLMKAYQDDYCLNNIWHHRRRVSLLPRRFLEFNDVTWEWDDIGYEMLHNRLSTIGFKGISLSTLTSIAKACARMYARELIRKAEGVANA